MKKIFILLLSVIMFFLPACKPDSIDTTSVTTNNGTDSSIETEIVTKPMNRLDSLPPADYDGRKFRIIAYSADDRPSLHDGIETGDIINDTMYRRDTEVSELFNIVMEYTGNDNRSKIQSDVQKLIAANEDVYDLIINAPVAVNTLSPGGYLYDLSTVPYLSLDSEWWCRHTNDAMTFNGKTFVTSGPLALSYLYSAYTFFYNINIADNYGIGDLTTTVTDGKWTIDIMAKHMKDIAQDINNDGKMDQNDFYGLTATDESGTAFYIGCGQSMISYDADGIPMLNLDSERSITVLEKLNGIMKTPDVIKTETLGNNTAGIPYKVSIFMDSNSLFSASALQWAVAYFRSMEDDYGILPFPKYDELQDNYRTYLTTFFPIAIAVPVTCTDPEFVGLVMESLAYLSHTDLVPEIFDVVLKEKIARNESSVKMLDLIYENMYTDLNGIFNFGDTRTMLRKYAVANMDNFISQYESVKETAESALEALIQAHYE